VVVDAVLEPSEPIGRVTAEDAAAQRAATAEFDRRVKQSRMS
jgi:hypothetical protein